MGKKRKYPNSYALDLNEKSFRDTIFEYETTIYSVSK